jgi:prolipoprotein diacylglyceryltransferase
MRISIIYVRLIKKMHNIEVPNSVAFIMLGILATVAAVYTATTIVSNKHKKDLFKYGGYLIGGMVVGGGLGLGVALASNLNLGEFWELGATLAGCILGGFVASYVYARRRSRVNN